jgi:hypothetical protein
MNNYRDEGYMEYAIAVVFAVALVALMFLWYKRRTTEKFTLPPMTFTQVPVDRTYKFASPIPEDASAFDKQLHAFTDSHVPQGVIAEGEPEATPYTDTEVQRVVERALKRAKSVGLRYVSTEFATKTADTLGGETYEIAFIAYDPLKNFAVKLALIALVTKADTMYIKEFRSFSVPDRGDGPIGTNNFSGTDGEFVQDLGLNYVNLYG